MKKAYDHQNANLALSNFWYTVSATFYSVYALFSSLCAENFPPKILVGPTEVNVTVNTLATIIVIAEDPNNDSLTFTVTGALPADYTKSSNDSSISLSWSVTTTKVIDILFASWTLMYTWDRRRRDIRK